MPNTTPSNLPNDLDDLKPEDMAEDATDPTAALPIDPDADEISLDELQEIEEEWAPGDDTLSPDAPPQRKGEQAASGHMPDPESDDDMLQASHDMGLRLDEDLHNPQPLNIAEDVAKAEKHHRDDEDSA